MSANSNTLVQAAAGAVSDEQRSSAGALIREFGLAAGAASLVAVAFLTPDEAAADFSEGVATLLAALASAGSLAVGVYSLHRAWVETPGASVGAQGELALRFQGSVTDELRVALGLASGAGDPVQTRRFRQVLGAVVAAGGYASLWPRVGALPASSLPGVASPKDALLKWAAQKKHRVSFEVLAMSGPGHDPTFEVRVQVTGVGSASGTGSSKKKAENDAARVLLAEKDPEALSSRVISRKDGPAISVVRRHADEVARLCRLLGLPANCQPRVSAALTSPTFAGDAPKANRETARRLAQLGSEVLRLDVACRVVEAATERRILVATTPVVNELCSLARLAAILKQLTHGHVPGVSPEGVPTQRAQADALQALAAVVLLERADPLAFSRAAEPMDRAFIDALNALAEQPVDLRHPKDQLREELIALGIDIQFSTQKRIGPAHNAQHLRRATLMAADGRELPVQGPTGRSIRDADRKLSALVLRAIDLPDGLPEKRAAHRVARFVLQEGGKYLAADPTRVERASKRALGALPAIRHSDWSEADRWLTNMDLWSGSETREAWETLHRRLIQQRDGALPDALVSTTVQIVSRVADLDPASGMPALSDERIGPPLLAAADIARLRAKPRACRRVSEVLSDITFLLGRSHELAVAPAPEEDPVLIERSGTALMLVDRLLATVDRAASTQLSTHLDGRRLHMRITTASSEQSFDWPLLSDLLRQDMPLVDLDVQRGRAEIVWHADPSRSLIRLMTGEDEVDDAGFTRVAGALHDLKNRLAAYDAVLQRPSSTQTAALKQQYEASLHLDKARAICQELLTREAEAARTGTASVDIGAVLSDYIADVAGRLPRHIAVAFPALPTLRCMTSVPLVISCLDNLTKNAVEAMPQHGHLTYELQPDGERVRISVRDSGPGLAPDQVDNIHSGAPLASTKRTGSGLGLAAVRLTMQQLGGELEVTSRPSGTTMTLVLPSAAP